MLIRSRKPWDVVDHKTTDENVYLNRRSLLRAMGIAGAGLASASVLGGSFAPLVSCLLYTSPSPRDRQKSRMPSSA